jgi:hypothetical protein
MEIVSYNNCADLDALGDTWDYLGEKELTFVPSFSELKYQLEAGGYQFRLLVAIDKSQIVSIACFIYNENAIRGYQLAAKKLFDLPVKEVSLFGSCVLGQPSENVIQKFFRLIIEASGFDVINIGQVHIGSPLYNAITSLHHGVIAWRERKKRLWWLIRLPGSFDEYMASLRATTRTAISKAHRKLEREDPKFHVVQFPNEVENFLRDAENISRLSYQWNLGYGLCNDESTRQQFMRLAKNGALRCYIVYLRGKPCAFSWGELSHRKFVWHMTGYDPQYRKLSPGTTLLMWMIRDLIENTNCEVCDFKWGEKEGYKSRFATISLSCSRMQVAQIYRPYSLLIVALDQMLNFSKNFVEKLLYAIFGHGALRQRLRSAMHRYGIATY